MGPANTLAPHGQGETSLKSCDVEFQSPRDSLAPFLGPIRAMQARNTRGWWWMGRTHMMEVSGTRRTAAPSLMDRVEYTPSPMPGKVAMVTPKASPAGLGPP
jgi:hypothetical protein